MVARICIALTFVLVFCGQAFGQVTEEDLMGVGFGAEKAEQLVGLRETLVNPVITGTATGTSDTGLGWTVESAANTACNTTCGAAACVFGSNTASGFVPVECDAATADICICAGDAS